MKVQNTVPARAAARPAASRPAAASPEERAERVARWVIALFFVALFIPGSFYMGVRMTPFRLLLIAMAIPMVLRYRNDPTIRLTVVDALIFLACAWRGLALFANHGTEQLVFAGASFMELFFGYLLGRIYVRDLAMMRYFFGCFLVFLVVSLPFGLLETVTHTRVLRGIAGTVLLQPPLEAESSPQIRFGLMRVQLSFDHAILFGTFCALGFANVFYLNRFPRNVLFMGFVGFMGLLAISSSTILALMLQVCLIAYERVLRPIAAKWAVLAIVAAVVLGSFQLVFGMSPVEYVAFNLTMNMSGALARFDQIHYGLLEIQRHPFFGIGLGEFTRPFWRADVFDNFWLAMGVRYGAPTTIFFALGFLAHGLRAAFARELDPEEARARIGYLIPLAVLVILLGTHSIWASAMVYVMLYVGIGAWIYDTPREAAPRRRIGPDGSALRRTAPGPDPAGRLRREPAARVPQPRRDGETAR